MNFVLIIDGIFLCWCAIVEELDALACVADAQNILALL